MKILALNIRHGGGKRLESLVAYFSRTSPDILVLSEFRNGTLQNRLSSLGYQHQINSTVDRGVNAVCIASRYPLVPIFLAAPVIDAHRIVACVIGNMTLCGVYFPLNKAKAALFHFLLSKPPQLAEKALLVGDFNTGLHYLDETGGTFACTDLFGQLPGVGLIDLWRRQHGDGVREYSWKAPRTGNGFRIDHAFATADIAEKTFSCRYDHQTRPLLSDHSAVVVEVADAR